MTVEGRKGKGRKGGKHERYPSKISCKVHIQMMYIYINYLFSPPTLCYSRFTYQDMMPSLFVLNGLNVSVENSFLNSKFSL